ncbi:radical SAM protein [bacterium]|nr:radical SAM protein [bacterium]
MSLKKSIAKFVSSKILKRDDLADVMWDRIPDFKTFFKSSLNHIFYLFRIPYSPYLTSLMIEVTNRCNLKCLHCPTKEMKRSKGDIDPELVKRIVTENKSLSYIYFYNWGEPFLHADLWDMIKFAFDKRIKTCVITNGTLIHGKVIEKIFSSSLSTISFSMDGIENDYTGERGYDYDKLKKGIIEFVAEKRKRGLSSPRIELNVVLKEDNPEFINKIEIEWREHVDTINYQPLIKYEDFERKSPCRELWKGNLVVLWDGRVVPCCVDYEGELVLGNAKEESLKDIWKRINIKKFRTAHVKTKFMPLCKRCSEVETKKAPRRFS